MSSLAVGQRACPEPTWRAGTVCRLGTHRVSSAKHQERTRAFKPESSGVGDPGCCLRVAAKSQAKPSRQVPVPARRGPTSPGFRKWVSRSRGPIPCEVTPLTGLGKGALPPPKPLAVRGTELSRTPEGAVSLGLWGESQRGGVPLVLPGAFAPQLSGSVSGAQSWPPTGNEVSLPKQACLAPI